MHKQIAFFAAILALLSFVACAEKMELYSTELLTLSDGAEAIGNCEIRINADNTGGAEDRYCNFFHECTSEIKDGTIYTVEYEIDVHNVIGECRILVDSMQGENAGQLYDHTIEVWITETGRITGSYSVRGFAETENGYMLRSFACIGKGASLDCNIEISVMENEDTVDPEMYSPRCIDYSNDKVHKTESGTVSLAIHEDGDSFANFFHAPSENIEPGEFYRVEYEIDTSYVDGEAYIFIDSQSDTQISQLYTNDRQIIINENGILTGSYIIQAPVIPEDNAKQIFFASFLCICQRR